MIKDDIISAGRADRQALLFSSDSSSPTWKVNREKETTWGERSNCHGGQEQLVSLENGE